MNQHTSLWAPQLLARHSRSVGLSIALGMMALAPTRQVMMAQGPRSGGVIVDLVAAKEAPNAPKASSKSPAVAGILSWLLFPGVGSYYAGNSGHGTRHVLLAVGSIAAIVAGVAQTGDYGDYTSAGSALILGGVVAYVANDIWGILTAIHDAERHNEAAGLSSVVKPELRVLTAAGPKAVWSPAPLRLGLQVVRLSF